MNKPRSASTSLQPDFEATLLASLKSGRWKPGDRLPTTAELTSESGCDLRTVQRVLAALAAQGVLDRRPRLGTFVRETPAPLTIGLLTGWNLKLDRNAFPRLFVHEVEQALAALGYRLHLFDDLFASMVNDETIWHEGMKRLKEEMEAVAPAGFVELQVHLNRLSPLYPEWQRPTVHCSRKEYGAEVYFDRLAFYRESLDWLAARGCRRVMLIRKGALLESFPEEDDTFWQGVKRGRFLRSDIREIFVREQHPDYEGEAARLIDTLALEWRHARRTEIPDALLVTDDVMMRGVATSLLRHGLSDSLTLVTMATEGIPHHYGVPVTRYEYPLPALAQEIARRLHLKLSKQPSPKGPTALPGRLLEVQSLSQLPTS